MNAVEQMREAAMVECQRIADEAKGYGITQMAMGANACRDAIRALPLPPAAPLAEAAKALADAIDQMTDTEYLHAAYAVYKALQPYGRAQAASALRQISEGGEG